MNDDISEKALNDAFLYLLEKMQKGGMTQKVIAEKIGVSAQYLTLIKQGKKNAQFRHVANLCGISHQIFMYKKGEIFFTDENFI